jgi:hypothetical protein
MKGEHSYRITFTDTAYVDTLGEAQTIFEPYSFSLFDMTENSYVAENDINVHTPLVMDGVQLYFTAPPRLVQDAINSKWSRNDIVAFYFDLYEDGDGNILGEPIMGDFLIKFGEIGMDTSTYFQPLSNLTLDPKPVNFTITNLLTGKDVPFAFYERDRRTLGEGAFSLLITNRSDEIIFLKPGQPDTGYVSSWHLKLISATNPGEERMPQNGDSLTVFFHKPFTISDTLVFTTPAAPKYNENLVAASLENIQVVPNPYVVTNEFEPTNYYVQGHGDRHLHFVNLPAKCTIRIYTLSGQHVDTIEHDVGHFDRGEAIWDMATKEEMDIGFGVYIYHVDAGKYGQKIGKFAVIK